MSLYQGNIERALKAHKRWLVMKLSQLRFRIWDNEGDFFTYKNIIRSELGGFDYSCLNEVDEIELYTGFKDRKGQMVYEGDIVKGHNGNLSYVVEFLKHNKFMLKSLASGDYFSIIELGSYDIVGHIHDKELLRIYKQESREFIKEAIKYEAKEFLNFDPTIKAQDEAK